MALEVDGPLIRRLREDAGFTLRMLAGRAGLDPASLSRIERGLQDPSPPMALRLADALGVAIADLRSAS